MEVVQKPDSTLGTKYSESDIIVCSARAVTNKYVSGRGCQCCSNSVGKINGDVGLLLIFGTYVIDNDQIQYVTTSQVDEELRKCCL